MSLLLVIYGNLASASGKSLSQLEKSFLRQSRKTGERHEPTDTRNRPCGHGTRPGVFGDRRISTLPDRLTRALSILERLEAGASQPVQTNLDAFLPDTAELIPGYAFTDIVGRDGIDLKTREILTVAMLAAMGTVPGQR
jgi:hypothetical protein